MNKNNTRCTIIFGGRDYYIFNLVCVFDASNKYKNEANFILKHNAAADVQFAIFYDDPQANYIIGNLRK